MSKALVTPEQARLIAAAPELLEALKVAEYIIEAARTDGPDWMLDSYQSAHETVGAAIAKATDTQP